MIIERVFDKQLIESFIRHPDIWKELTYGMSEDDINRFAIRIKNDNYYGIGYVDDTIIGMGQVLKSPNKKYYCHLQVLPEYRTKYGLEFGFKVLGKFWKIVKPNKTNELYLIVRPELRHIIMYALKLGFKKVSLDKHYSRACLKPDPNYKRWLLKLTREDYYAVSRRYF